MNEVDRHYAWRPLHVWFFVFLVISLFGLTLWGCADWSTVALMRFQVDLGEFGGPIPEDRLPALARASRSWQPTVRGAATRLLAISGAPDTTEPLLARVRDERRPWIWAIAVAAIHPASRLDSALDGRASFVRTQLRSADPKVRTAALRALPHAGLPDAATGCAEALPDLNPEVRVEALHCLAATEPTRHLSALVDRAYVEEYGPARIALLDAMGGVLDPQVATGAARLLKREAEAPKMTGGPGRPLAQLARSPAPWARDVLSEVACKEGALQAAAVRAFGGLSVPQCIAELCQDATESRPSGGEVATPASLRKACLSLEPVPH